MVELLYDSKSVERDDKSGKLRVEYYLLSDCVNLPAGETLCENYGAKIALQCAKSGDYSKDYRNITTDYKKINSLLCCLSRNCVTPVHFCDVLEDWLSS